MDNGEAPSADCNDQVRNRSDRQHDHREKHIACIAPRVLGSVYCSSGGILFGVFRLTLPNCFAAF